MVKVYCVECHARYAQNTAARLQALKPGARNLNLERGKFIKEIRTLVKNDGLQHISKDFDLPFLVAAVKHLPPELLKEVLMALDQQFVARAYLEEIRPPFSFKDKMKFHDALTGAASALVDARIERDVRDMGRRVYGPEPGYYTYKPE
jgi:hypothetical protein